MIGIEDLLGKPFRDHGRGDGYDCYGLAIEVSRRFGRELPDLEYDRSENIDFHRHFAEGRGAVGGRVARADKPKAGDLVVFMDERGRRVHIGVMLERDDFIHCDRYGSRVTRLRDYGKEYEVYRWQA